MTIDRLEKLATQFTIDPVTKCWNWKHTTPMGYGFYANGRKFGGKVVRSHRLMYELTRGPIPEGLVSDHLCRNKACANPWHIEPVTQATNVRRIPKDVIRRSHCKRGHKFTPDSVYVTPSTGGRKCNICKRALRRLYFIEKGC